MVEEARIQKISKSDFDFSRSYSIISFLRKIIFFIKYSFRVNYNLFFFLR